jgi:alkylation response protein AidB-like acyl-CoA dehydrogenase
MEIRLTEEQGFFRDTTRKFLESEMPTTVVRELESNPIGFELEWWRRGAELGWTSLLVSEELGGGSLSGNGLLDLVLVAEEMGHVVAPGPLLPVNLVAAAIAQSGTPEQCDGYLPGLMSGEVIGTWAFYEGGPWSLSTVAARAEPSGHDYVVSGAKTIVEAADAADLLLVTARSGEGLINCLVPTGSAGVTVRPMESLDIVRRYGTVTLEGVTVPRSAVLGDPTEAPDQIERLLHIAAVLQCHETNGAIAHVFEMTTQYAADRFAFGRPLNSYQALKHRFADMKMWLEGCHGVATQAARAVENGAANAAELTSAAKAYVGERSTDLIEDCVQLHGGIGVTWEHDLHLYLRRATVNRVTYGTPAEHRERIAALLAL